MQNSDSLSATILNAPATSEAISGQLQALALNESEARALVDSLIENAHQQYGKPPSAKYEVAKRALLVAEEIGYDFGQATSLIYIGSSQWMMSRLDEALKNLLKAKTLFAALDDKAGQMKALTYEACVYRSLGDLDQSYLDLKSCVDFFRKAGDTTWEIIALLGLAITCELIGDHASIKKYNQRIIKIVTDPRMQWMAGRALDGIGTIYYERREYHKALEYYEKSLATCNQSHHPIGGDDTVMDDMGAARALNDIGMVHQKLGNTAKARQYYHESLKIRQEIGQREAQCTCLFNLGELVLQAGEPQRALEYFKQALVIAVEVGAKPRISQAHQNLSRVFEELGDTASALHHHKEFHKAYDEVTSEQSSTRTKNLRMRLELDKAEKLAEVERSKNTKLSEKNDELQRLLNELHAAQAQLVQAEKMATLGKLVAGVAHEMNSPLGACISSTDISRRCISQIMTMLESGTPLDGLKNDGRLEKLWRTLLNNTGVVAEAHERISKIVQSLRSFSNLDQAGFQKANIHEGLDSTITLLEADLNGKIKITKQYGNLQPIGCYPGELNQVFLNLLSNSVEAIQRANHPGEIVVQTSLEDNQVHIKISDDGSGISAERIKTLFEPAFADKQTRVKAGMGLFISQNIIQKHKGKITVASEVNKGTTITVTLPAYLDAQGAT